MPDWLTGQNIIAAIAVGGVVFTTIRWIVLTTQDRSDFKQDRSDFKTFMGRIDKELSGIRASVNRILGKLGDLGEPLIERASPLQLTSFGHTNANEMDAQAWANAASALLADQAVKDGLQPYEIDQLCGKHTQNSLSSQMSNTVARVSFERGIKVSELLAVLHIVLRDAVLKRVKAG